jgi:hypothetical protein
MKPHQLKPSVPAASGTKAPAVGVPRADKFTVTLAPTSAELGPQEVTSVIIATKFPQETSVDGTVPETVAPSVEGLPEGVTGDFNPAVIGPTDLSQLLLSALGDVQPGTYRLTVKGKLALFNTADGTRTYREDSATLDLVVRPFSLVLPASVTVQQGKSAQVPVSLTRSAGFTEAVDLSLASSRDGITGSFSPASATGNASTLTLSVAPDVAPGRYSLDVVGCSGPVSRTASMSLVVPSFALAVSPTNLVVVSGTSPTVDVTIDRKPGFTGNVSLSLDSPNAGISGTFRPVVLKGSDLFKGVSSSTLTLNVAGSVPPGNYTLLVRAASGGLVKSAVVNLIVRHFQLSLSDTDVVLKPSGSPEDSVAVTVSIARSVGFTGSVSLSLEGLPVTSPGAGIGHSFNPSSTTGNTSTLHLHAGRLAAAGFHLLTVRGTSSGQSESAALAVEILDTGGLGEIPGRVDL